MRRRHIVVRPRAPVRGAGVGWGRHDASRVHGLTRPAVRRLLRLRWKQFQRQSTDIMKASVPQAGQLCHELLGWPIPQLDKFPRVRRYTWATRADVPSRNRGSGAVVGEAWNFGRVQDGIGKSSRTRYPRAPRALASRDCSARSARCRPVTAGAVRRTKRLVKADRGEERQRLSLPLSFDASPSWPARESCKAGWAVH